MSDSIEPLGNDVFYIFEGGALNQLVIGQENRVGVVIRSTLLSGVKDIILEEPFVYAKANGIIDTISIRSYVSQYGKRDGIFSDELVHEGDPCNDCWFIIDTRTQQRYGPIYPATFVNLRR
ncbi:hypothetical protein LEM8419_01746 [Neolewinella maritima]|uniref:Uncharacterized protein n=1 Tax=Neolewinella maritima TaxID=1383882 RepID=A0ABN8F6H3_9BACT|nr:hypothetical protein LEM8419_01746 [Neolewinella maritima]